MQVIISPLDFFHLELSCAAAGSLGIFWFFFQRLLYVLFLARKSCYCKHFLYLCYLFLCFTLISDMLLNVLWSFSFLFVKKNKVILNYISANMLYLGLRLFWSNGYFWAVWSWIISHKEQNDAEPFQLQFLLENILVCMMMMMMMMMNEQSLEYFYINSFPSSFFPILFFL